MSNCLNCGCELGETYISITKDGITYKYCWECQWEADKRFHITEMLKNKEEK